MCGSKLDSGVQLVMAPFVVLVAGEEFVVQLVITCSGCKCRLRDNAFAVHRVELLILQVARLIVTSRCEGRLLHRAVDLKDDVTGSSAGGLGS